jgi:hypothetical protein
MANSTKKDKQKLLSDYATGHNNVSLDTCRRNDLSNERVGRITKLLLENRGEIYWWPLSDSIGKKPTKKVANKFLFLHMMDYQTDSTKLADKVQIFIEEELEDPSNLWDVVTGYKLNDWMDITHSLHWLSAARKRPWVIGKDIVEIYDGDARKLWINQDYETISHNIYNLLGGEAIPRMILGALYDTKQIEIVKGDVKPDIHVKRVLGRIVLGRELDEMESLNLTREMYPENPWLLDRPLFNLGTSICSKKHFYCDECFMQFVCKFCSNS